MTDLPGRRPRAGCEGVTLVELMVVLVIIAIGLLALSGVQTRSSRDVDATGRSSRALNLAENRMEVVRAAGFTQAQSDSGVSAVFTWNAQVTAVDPYLKRVTVTVSWLEKGEARSVQLNNLVSSR